MSLSDPCTCGCTGSLRWWQISPESESGWSGSTRNQTAYAIQTFTQTGQLLNATANNNNIIIIIKKINNNDHREIIEHFWKLKVVYNLTKNIQCINTHNYTNQSYISIQWYTHMNKHFHKKAWQKHMHTRSCTHACAHTHRIACLLRGLTDCRL